MAASSQSMGFFLNVFIKFNGVFPKCFSLNSVNSVKKMPPSHLLCKRPAYYHSASKTHVKDRILKLSPIHASVIYQLL